MRPSMRIWGAVSVVMCRSVPPYSTMVLRSCWSGTTYWDEGSAMDSSWGSEHGFADDFLDGRHPVEDLATAAAAQGDHAFLHRLLPQFDGAGAREDHVLQRLAHLQHFVEAHAALVAPLPAHVAAPAVHDRDAAVHLLLGEAHLQEGLRRGLVGLGLLAGGADAPHEALGADDVHGGGHQEGFHAHVHEAADGA